MSFQKIPAGSRGSRPPAMNPVFKKTDRLLPIIELRPKN